MKFLKSHVLCFIILSTFLNCTKMNSQDLKKHQWENRLILVLTDASKSIEFKNQILELEAHKDGLDERKLFVYQIKPEVFKTGFSNSKEWTKSSKLFSEFANEYDSFRVILIGLDGGIKLEQTKFLSAEKLFSTIDAMPMRRSEMRKN